MRIRIQQLKLMRIHIQDPAFLYAFFAFLVPDPKHCQNFSAIRQQNLRMRSSLVVRASDCQCTSCNGPGFDPSIRRHSRILGAADEAVLNIERRKNKKSPPKFLKNFAALRKSFYFTALPNIHNGRLSHFHVHNISYSPGASSHAVG
jgi:hypothetical protein